ACRRCSSAWPSTWRAGTSGACASSTSAAGPGPGSANKTRAGRAGGRAWGGPARVPREPARRGWGGPPLPGVEARVVDEADRDVPPGEPGELIFRCGTLMLGYWHQPELTGRTLRVGLLHCVGIGQIDEAGAR